MSPQKYFLLTHTNESIFVKIEINIALIPLNMKGQFALVHQVPITQMTQLFANILIHITLLPYKK